jgi:hypothetical protein
LNYESNIQQTIAIKMMKDTITQEQDIVKQIITNAPLFVVPRSDNSTFEVIA